MGDSKGEELLSSPPLPVGSGIGPLRDSADTAGGATPRRPPQEDASMSEPRGSLLDEVPRILCPSSPSMSSDSSLEELADFDVGSSSVASSVIGCALVPPEFSHHAVSFRVKQKK